MRHPDAAELPGAEEGGRVQAEPVQDGEGGSAGTGAAVHLSVAVQNLSKFFRPTQTLLLEIPQFWF